jgi:ABC-type branched-subunit amino acid transport system substrate-binding protein
VALGPVSLWDTSAPALRLCLAVLLGIALVALAACGGARGRSIGAAPPAAQAPVAALPAPTVPQPQMGGAVKVGLLLPLTGTQAELGQSLRKTADMAFFDIAPDDFELVPGDTRSTPEGAEQATREVIAKGAQLILGPLLATDAQRAAPIARASGVPLISFSTDASLAGNGVYVMGILPQIQVQRIVSYASRQGVRKMGALVPANAYGRAIATALQTAAPRASVTVGSISTYDPGAEDKSINATEMAAGGFDAGLVPEGGDSLRALAPSLVGNTQLLGSTLWDDPSLAGVASLEGAWFAAPPREKRNAFEQRYQSTYGTAPPRLGTTPVYDAVALAATLAKSHLPLTNETLTQPSGFSGLDGIFRFRPDGTVERGLAVMQFRSGQAVVLEPAATTFDQLVF